MAAWEALREYLDAVGDEIGPRSSKDELQDCALRLRRIALSKGERLALRHLRGREAGEQDCHHGNQRQRGEFGPADARGDRPARD